MGAPAGAKTCYGDGINHTLIRLETEGRIVDVETFIQSAGGEYFFLPSIPALKYQHHRSPDHAVAERGRGRGFHVVDRSREAPQKKRSNLGREQHSLRAAR